VSPLATNAAGSKFGSLAAASAPSLVYACSASAAAEKIEDRSRSSVFSSPTSEPNANRLDR